MPGTLEVIGELIEVIHKSMADMQTQIEELKTHDGADVRTRLSVIEKKISELNDMYFTYTEKGFEDV